MFILYNLPITDKEYWYLVYYRGVERYKKCNESEKCYYTIRHMLGKSRIVCVIITNNNKSPRPLQAWFTEKFVRPLRNVARVIFVNEKHY